MRGTAEPAGRVGTSADERAFLSMHAGKRLYGGAQYWRALEEFMLGAAEAPEEELTVEEIVNAMGFVRTSRLSNPAVHATSCACHQLPTRHSPLAAGRLPRWRQLHARRLRDRAPEGTRLL